MLSLFKEAIKSATSTPSQPVSVMNKFIEVKTQLRKIATTSVPVIVVTTHKDGTVSKDVEKISCYKVLFGDSQTQDKTINAVMANMNDLLTISQKYEAYKTAFEDSVDVKSKKLNSAITEHVAICKDLDTMLTALENRIGEYVVEMFRERNNFVKLSEHDGGILDANSRDYLAAHFDSELKTMSTSIEFYKLIRRAHHAIVANQQQAQNNTSINNNATSSVGTFVRRGPGFGSIND